MSYSGPPGLSKNTSTHPSLPPRPPPAKLQGVKPAFSPSNATTVVTTAPGYPATTGAPSYSSAPGYGPSSAPGGYGAPPTAYGAGPQLPPVGAAGSYSYPQQQSYAQQPSYYGAPATNSYSTPPQIRNPFPVPGTQGPEFDPEMAAQIAQWQSAYMPRDPMDTTAKGPGATGRAGPTGSAVSGHAASAAAATDGADHHAGATGEDKKKTVYREGGGKKWQDDSLLEWDPAHLRLFVGNLAGETTDESLLKAFSRWKSVQKAKVVRDKRTTKSKGFGFVSFSDPEDFFQAAKEMNGKYIQSHPVVVHKAKTEIKPAAVKDDRRGGKHNKKNNKEKKSGSGAGHHHQEGSSYEPHLGPMGGSGVTKPGQKTRGGLKLLG
ncbi:hypothetical protein B0T16DRAFT_399627 [Cercophora newfieldiana]|uniref:RRM domain-containing protein n=1 Tax=Cercophora newfieldiana TaxID=92897 RepID=A0AA40CYR3_9PEZI|nr:hypothetical protein B0T16DRAFT_399627 [Cercophora newfieldiana]